MPRAVLVGIIGAGVGLDVIGVNLQYLFFAQGRPDILRRVYIRAVIFNVAANLIAIPLFTYYGAALTTLATFMLTAYLMWKNTKMPLSTLLDFAALKRCVLASMVMGIWVAVTVGSDLPHLLIAIVGGAIIYGVGIVSLKVISIAQLKQMLLRRGAA